MSDTFYASLPLTEDEVRLLKAIFRRVGGHPDTSPRGLTDKLYARLSELVAHNPDVPLGKNCDDASIEGTIHFSTGAPSPLHNRVRAYKGESL